MFRRLLIANRGEVCLRIARSARELGISPVGIVSSADADASWPAQLDEVVCIGGAAPRESYLRAEAVIQAARQTHCSAVHPGWGFLAEDPRFAAACEQHGLTFVGPTSALMQRMGLKWPAKVAMRSAGLDGIPGCDGLLRDVEDAVRAAEATGYPVILKADAGGGGRGMRLCRGEAEVREAFPQAVLESQAAFGNGALYLESFLQGGRHIEVQILCDHFGNAIHLGERECSIQRNHQKLIEESPSPALDAEGRAAIGRRAAQAAAHLGYRGAGTIEFLQGADGVLRFMEMNTRLQVEHPISEEVTGVDIVAQQLRIAANQRLTIAQDDVELRGHAIECRINAEDPSAKFRPTPGKLTAFDLPTEVADGRVRVETHLQQGDSVSPHYDSLVAKLIVWSATRERAIDSMLLALKACRIEGIATTIPLHIAVLESAAFRAGDYDTSSIPGWSS